MTAAYGFGSTSDEVFYLADQEADELVELFRAVLMVSLRPARR